MRKRIKKPINPFRQDSNDGITKVSVFDIENDRDFLLNLVLQHKQAAACSPCVWTIAIFKNDGVAKPDLKKNCLLAIAIEFILIGKLTDTLTTGHGFQSVVGYNPEEPVMNANVLIYCD